MYAVDDCCCFCDSSIGGGDATTELLRSQSALDFCRYLYAGRVAQPLHRVHPLPVAHSLSRLQPARGYGNLSVRHRNLRLFARMSDYIDNAVDREGRRWLFASGRLRRKLQVIFNVTPAVFMPGVRLVVLVYQFLLTETEDSWGS